MRSKPHGDARCYDLLVGAARKPGDGHKSQYAPLDSERPDGLLHQLCNYSTVQMSKARMLHNLLHVQIVIDMVQPRRFMELNFKNARLGFCI
jgi:hypothetical protein